MPKLLQVDLEWNCYVTISRLRYGFLKLKIPISLQDTFYTNFEIWILENDLVKIKFSI